MKKKMELEAVYFDAQELTDNRNFERTKKNAEKIGVKLHRIPYGELLQEFDKNCDSKFICVFCKRTMLKLSEKLAKKIGAEVLINGDNLGQVASQTMQNLVTVSQATKLPIIRPLIGMDKQEIINIAREIGTYEISIEKALCCSAVPKKPSTACKPEKIKQEESKINIDKLISKSIEEVI